MSQNKIQIITFLIPLLPFLGFLIHIIFNNKISESVAGIHASAWICISFLLSCILFIELNTVQEIQVHLFTWIKTGNFNIPFAFLIDHLSIIMMLVITGVGGLIHIYSIGYMHGDRGFKRFFCYLNLFIFFMLILVMANNYVLMFVGWEGVGLCSYLLIGFWFKNQEFNSAANKAFIMNRIGDLALLFGLFLIFQNFDSLIFKDVFANAKSNTVDINTLTLLTILLFIGACGKSAQIPLFTWLPDAMAGPTPVSALIHAATMVTAGIYLIVRSNVLFSLTPTTLEIIMIVGIVTALFAGTIAIKQNDIKKVLAYSTVSQLGLMFFALGLGAYEAAFFHLVTHAFFKALLFLGAGSIIHGLGGIQDIRKMGGLRHHMKITHWTFAIGIMAIIALPPFAGFYSKDNILASAFSVTPILWSIGLISGLITVFYMMRLYFLVFYGESRMTETVKSHIHESPGTITIPLLILSVLSVIGGWINIPDIFNGAKSLLHYLAPIVPTHLHHISHTTEWILIILSISFILVFVGLAFYIYVIKAIVPEEDSAIQPGIGKLLHAKYYVDEIYNAIIVKPLTYISNFLYAIVDLKIIDGAVNGSAKMANYFSNQLKNTQTGNISFYLFVMALGMGGILIFTILI